MNILTSPFGYLCFANCSGEGEGDYRFLNYKCHFLKT